MSRKKIRQYLGDGVLNLTWFAVTIVGLVGTHLIWPYRSWSWGLLLGACIGASAMMVVAYLARWTRADEYLYGVDSDV